MICFNEGCQDAVSFLIGVSFANRRGVSIMFFCIAKLAVFFCGRSCLRGLVSLVSWGQTCSVK